MLDRLLATGAGQLEGLEDCGSGFVTATVVDPFGNILGVMRNPHYLEVLGPRTVSAAVVRTLSAWRWTGSYPHYFTHANGGQERWT